MDFNSRIERLKMLLVAAGKTVEGRKKLQKLAFLCQAAGDSLGQSFVFHHYGVYSASLADDISAAANMGVIGEHGGAGAIVTRLEKPYECDFSSRGFQLVANLKNEESRLLEVLSTIVYLDSQGYKGEQLAQKLIALKGMHNAFFDRAYELANSEFGIPKPKLN